MDKLLQFGRKAMFYVRVLSGYEERRIRSHRLQLEKRIQQSLPYNASATKSAGAPLSKAQERKAALRKIPEQAVLSEVRRMVEEMQTLNKKLEETEAAIQDYFKPIDKQAEIIMNMQLQKEEKNMKEMMKAMHEQALREKDKNELKTEVHNLDATQHDKDTASSTPKQA